MELAVLVWIICGMCASYVASERGNSGCLWFGLGGLFGPFGLIAAFASGEVAKCPTCLKSINPKASKCHEREKLHA